MPHPCAVDATIKGCAEIAAQQGEKVAGTVKEALVANAPAIMERMNEALLRVGEWVEATENFAVEQAPLLVKEILYWAVADQAFWVLLGIGLMTYCYFGLRWTFRYATRLKQLASIREEVLREQYREAGMHYPEEVALTVWRFAVPISSCVLGVFGFLFFVCNIMDLLQPIVAPRLYLIEYFRSLL